MARGRHARSATGTLGGAPYGATKRVRGVHAERRAEGRGKEGQEGGGGEEEERGAPSFQNEDPTSQD
eukprot:2993603-Pyramimonas_sp.AAC.1